MIFEPTRYKGELIPYPDPYGTYIDFRYIAEFFVCPNYKCQEKIIPDSGDVLVNAYGSNKKPIDISRDLKSILMICTKCSKKGFFTKKAFCQFKCGLCHNNILRSDGNVWFDCFGTIGERNHNIGTDLVQAYTPQPSKGDSSVCNSCNTLGVRVYIPKLESYNRGIVFSDSTYVEWKDRSTFYKIQSIIMYSFLVLVLLMLLILIW